MYLVITYFWLFHTNFTVPFTFITYYLLAHYILIINQSCGHGHGHGHGHIQIQTASSSSCVTEFIGHIVSVLKHPFEIPMRYVVCYSGYDYCGYNVQKN